MRRAAALAAFAALAALALPATPGRAQPASSAQAAPAPQRVPAGTLVDLLRQQFLDPQCRAARLAVDTAKTPEERDLQRNAMELTCGCLPAGVDAAFPDRAALVDAEAFQSRLRGAMSSCAARGIRHTVADLCARGVDPTASSPAGPATAAQQAHCSCMRAGLDQVDDRALAEDAMETYRQYVARAQARAAGASEPVFAPTASERVRLACVAQDAKR